MTYEELIEELRKLYENLDASEIEEHFAIQINIAGEAEGALYVEFADGRIEVQPYEYYDRDLIINTDFETLGCLYDEYTAAKKREEKWELYQEEQLIEDEYERDIEERELQDEKENCKLAKI